MSAPDTGRRQRIIRFLTEHAWLHTALIFGVIVFFLPFLWMVLTSLKTDEELGQRSWMPEIPTFVSHSPYVLAEPELDKPLPVPPERWEAVIPDLLEESRKAIRDTGVGDPTHIDAAAAVLVNRTAARLNSEDWSRDRSVLLAAFRDQLTESAVQAAIQDRLARLELRGLRIETMENRILPLANEKEIGSLFRVVSGPASLEHAADGTTFLKYEFKSPSDEPVVIEATLKTPADAGEWLRVSFSYRADSSWHRLHATIIRSGQAWISEFPSYLVQKRTFTSVFQFPSFEDSTLKPRTWVPMKQGRGVRGEGLDRIQIAIYPSSTAQAIWGKVTANYLRAFRAVPFWKYAMNSLILVILTTVGTLFSSTFVAYAFARLNWPGRSVAFVILLSTMMLPGQVTMIPSFMIWRQLGWYNTLNPLWAPSFFGGAFFIFLMVQHMKTIPRELEEAARIDGLGSIGIWWHIMVPLVKPAAAAIAIMTVMGAWNEFMGPLIYLRDQAKFPLSLGLFAVRLDAGNDWPMIMAGNVLMTIPMIVMFILFQRYFIQGMMMGSVKG